MGYTIDYGYIEHITEGNSRAKVFVDKINDRLRVINYSGNVGVLFDTLLNLAQRTGSGKIIIFVPINECENLEQNGFVLEGKIKGFFKGLTGFGYSFYVNKKRAQSLHIEKEDQILNKILNKQIQANAVQEIKHGNFKIRKATPDDIPALIDMYRNIFSSYPSPLMHENYMRQVMDNNVLFIGAFNGEKLVSAASLEIDKFNANAELTDCATLPNYRGRGILQGIMERLEAEGRKLGIVVIYSLARAGSIGMNLSLYKLGYAYEGRFLNNCHIGGRFEDMNLWVKV